MENSSTNTMNKIDLLNKVATFHRAFEQPVSEKPNMPSESRCELRVNLIEEELHELEWATVQKDIVSVADALCDLQYVLSGAILEFGLGEKFEELFNEVHRSNMSKACESEEEAKKTVVHYKENKDTDAYYVERDGKYLVYRKGDNKTLKSVNYSPVDFDKILKNDKR